MSVILYVNRTGCAWRYLRKDFPTRHRLRLLRHLARQRHPAARPLAVTSCHPQRGGARSPSQRGGHRLPVRAGGGHRAFDVLPRRWVVERTLAWISTHRRCARDYERLPPSHEAMVLLATIALMTQRLAHAPE